MKKLASAALLLASVGAVSGCVVTTDPIVDDGYFTVSWALDGGCPAGATTVWVLLDGLAEEAYDCSTTNTIDTDFYLLGNYTVQLEITDDGGTLYALSDAVNVSLDGDATFVPTFSFPTNHGYMALDWDLHDSIGQLNCEDVGADGVEVNALDLYDNSVYPIQWYCDEYTGVTDLLPVSNYSIIVYLLDANDNVLGESLPFDESITYGNELVELGLFDFEF